VQTRSADVLADPVGESLRGPHAHLARSVGAAVTYVTDVATFAAVPLDPSPADWDDLARLLGPGGFADLFSLPVTPPPDWEPVFRLEGLQMVLDEVPSRTSSRVRELTADDAPAMLTLAETTKPGPFWQRTPAMGRYVGIEDDGELVAMAGERLHPPGWTEISAVCTAPSARGRGLAAALVRDVAATIVERGERPFLHVAAANLAAVRLYERLGFEVRREVVFHGYRVPRG